MSTGSGLDTSENYTTKAEKKVAYLTRFAPGMSYILSTRNYSQLRLSVALEMLRSIIDHSKVFVLALNGPGVGGGAAWFTGVADIVLASSSAWLQVPFSALGLVPEKGSAINFAQSMGVHRTNEFLMFGRKLTAQELEQFGMVNRVFESKGGEFHGKVRKYLEEQLSVNDGKSMMEMKRLQNAPLRDGRLVAVMNSMDALAERFVEGAPIRRFEVKKRELEGEFLLASDMA